MVTGAYPPPVMAADDDTQEIPGQASPAPANPPGKTLVQIVIGLAIAGLAALDLFAPDTTVSPIVYGILGAIAAGPEVLRLINR